MAPGIFQPRIEAAVSVKICPDESTSCLLRAILDDNSTQILLREILAANTGFNWDPLSFAMTAVIGLLAFLVSLATVFQGLLASGSGRIKAVRAAIGPFAELTRTRFHREELRLQTRCYVPIIDIKSILQDGGNIQNDLQEVSTWSWRKLFPKLCTSVSKIRWKGFLTLNRSGSSHEFKATWMTLLARLGLQEIQTWYLAKIDTDHLPADIAAAPAIAEMKDLALLAVVADDDSTLKYNPDQQYITVTGPKSRLTFQNHSELGSVGVFELLEVPRCRPDRRRSDKLQIVFDQLLSEQLQTNHRDCQMLLSLAVGHFIFDGRSYSLQSNDSPLAGALAKLQDNTSFFPFPGLRSVNDKIFFGRRQIDLMLLFSEIPEGIRGFPSSYFGLYSAVKRLFKQLRHTSVDFDSVMKDSETLPDIISRLYTQFALELKSKATGANSSAVNHGSVTSIGLADSSRTDPNVLANSVQELTNETPEMTLFRNTESLCTTWFCRAAQDQGDEHDALSISLNLEEKATLRDTLSSIDQILNCNKKQAVRCALSVISHYPATVHYMDNQSHVQFARTNKWAGMSCPPRDDDKVSLNEIEAALYCRVLFFAAWLASTTDTSILQEYDTTLPKRQVRVL